MMIDGPTESKPGGHGPPLLSGRPLCVTADRRQATRLLAAWHPKAWR